MKGVALKNRSEHFVELIVSRLQSLAAEIDAQWNSPEGTDTRHFYIDNLLPQEEAIAIYNAFPRSGDGFFNRESFREKKKTSAHLGDYDAILADITYAIQDKRVVEVIENITGLSKLEPDPKLYAGGLSMMFKDDFLNPHIDNSHDADRKRYRRLNLLYYVSPDWAVENGGNLELWDDGVRTPKTLHSAFNRLVVMETNKTSWHSVSPVVSDLPRCCVSNYYFSAESPDQSEYFHVTLFTGRPAEGLKRNIGVVDNALRNLAAKTLKIGRGRDQMKQDD